MTEKIKDKVVMITGGTSGIGKAAALAFADQGAKVVVAARGVPMGEAIVAEIREKGAEAIFVPTDVSINSDVEALISKTVETFGSLDIAINNAGVEDNLLPTHLCTEENWDRVVGINLKGAFLCMKHEITQMLQQGGGAIVNITSVAGLRGFPGFPAYSASKGGLVQLTRTAALEYADAGIRINAVTLGGVDTPMIGRIFARAKELEMEQINPHPLQKVATGDEAAKYILWLASETTPYMIGHNMVVDGGWSIQ